MLERGKGGSGSGLSTIVEGLGHGSNGQARICACTHLESLSRPSHSRLVRTAVAHDRQPSNTRKQILSPDMRGYMEKI